MALTVVNFSSGGTNGGPFTTVASAAQNITAGNSIVVAVRAGMVSGATGVTDTAGNTYTYLSVMSTGAGDFWQYWYCNNCLGNSSNVVTAGLPASSNYTVIAAWQITGGPLTLDTQVSGIGSSGATLTTSSFSTAQANEIALVIGLNTTTLTTFGAAGGATLDSSSIASGTAGAEHLIYSSVQTGVTANMTQGLTNNWELFAAIFTTATGGGGGGSRMPIVCVMQG
jgi:hypothetical protein